MSAAGIYLKEGAPSPDHASANVFTASFVIGSLFVHVYGRAADLDTDPVSNYNIDCMLDLSNISPENSVSVPKILPEQFCATALSLEKGLLARRLALEL
ncbi:hypothetical protein MKK70_21245 [Methylobacterium sp. E-041]|uniref:hypothetical protein n=1 Tax=Methylobacterium sp. E-041 TaxID=2836573 RepID=UPI001FBB78B1|nr:hypothetical protein [Methylobacterium sp. E-041]MCJ2107856.1 hypothetical protein [Methylobacterium sp. E-041]